MGLAVGKNNEDPVRAVAAGGEQLPSLQQHRRETGSSLAGKIGIEPIEVHPDRAAVDRERRQDVAPSGERDQADPVALDILHQAAALPHRVLQPTRSRILRQHRPTDVHGEDQVERVGLGRHLGPPPSRAGKRHARTESGKRNRHRSTPDPAARRPPRARPTMRSQTGLAAVVQPRRARRARWPAAVRAPAAGESRRSRDPHHECRVSSSSSASAHRPASTNGRIASSYRV